ncbi:hypothetical protein [Bacillus pumilus]|uniref:hypothetical protein n=1 Tax=Bacillus pumilus TaxID=1408 RepID=UPI00031951AD|nr:hypothetical protein [Bacillus pumilus]MCR4355047.1 hypothetical protein [Bacillus pumilus]MCY7505739.1 hypothetical protein [Bacillus pumilus]MED4628832.1 hypothetical protein [Bacillus pumilus]MED4675606.1 hypothetical protein [Bacillus pumilus]MED4726089.1 hypothetical protein [Bacillus pumilus]
MPRKLKNSSFHELLFQRVDKPSHSLSVLRAGAHEYQIRSAKVAVLHRLQRFSITLKEDKGLK